MDAKLAPEKACERGEAPVTIQKVGNMSLVHRAGEGTRAAVNAGLPPVEAGEKMGAPVAIQKAGEVILTAIDAGLPLMEAGGM